MDLLIQFIGSAVLFLNKILLFRKKSFGWILGIIGIALISIPTYQKALWISLGYNAGLVTLMFYGYTLAKTTKKSFPRFWTLFFRVLIVMSTLIFCVYLFKETYYSKNFNVAQLLQSISGLSGSLFLAFNTQKSNIVGWCSNIISHFFAIFIFHQKELYIMEFFQVISIFVAIVAIKELQQDLPPEVLS
ncbi:MAG: hypothetical protein AAB438_01925 [Patescibacteria group bacterium]